jgi:hypothetical protein
VAAVPLQGEVLDHQELHVTPPQAYHPCNGAAGNMQAFCTVFFQQSVHAQVPDDISTHAQGTKVHAQPAAVSQYQY